MFVFVNLARLTISGDKNLNDSQESFFEIIIKNTENFQQILNLKRKEKIKVINNVDPYRKRYKYEGGNNIKYI